MTTNWLNPESIILVSVMPAVLDLEIARLLGWYRIPLRRSPKIIEVDYLAFYQTGTFGVDHRWRIEYIAEYRGHELVKRKELFKDDQDHPRANEEYFKLQLGPLQALSIPIPAQKWKRITFLYTTGELFNSAARIDDLVLDSDDRVSLWRSLRERALAGGRYQVEELPEVPLNVDFLRYLGSFLDNHPTLDINH